MKIKMLVMVAAILLSHTNLVNAQNNLEDCSLEDPSCGGTGEYKCIKRTVLDISNVESPEYKKALQNDRDLLKGTENYKCYPLELVEEVIGTNNKVDDVTTATFSYKIIEEISQCMAKCINKDKVWCKTSDEQGQCCDDKDNCSF